MQEERTKIKLYLFYKKTKDSFLHLIKISILLAFEHTTLPCSAKSTHLCWVLLCCLELLGVVPLIWHSLAEVWTLTIIFCCSLKVTANMAVKRRWQTELSDIRSNTSDQTRQSRHTSHMLLNNKQMEATWDTSELNQNYPKTSYSNWMQNISLKIWNSVSAWL